MLECKKFRYLKQYKVSVERQFNDEKNYVSQNNKLKLKSKLEKYIIFCFSSQLHVNVFCM